LIVGIFSMVCGLQLNVGIDRPAAKEQFLDERQLMMTGILPVVGPFQMGKIGNETISR
jgi:hypothetical protein